MYRFLKLLNALPDHLSLAGFAGGNKQYTPYYVDNAQVRYLAGERGEVIYSSPGACTRRMLETAVKRLDAFLIVGLTERFDESLVMLSEATGIRHLYYAPTRVSGRRAMENANEKTLEIIRERNALDIELYEHARCAFAKRVDEFGPAFKRSVERFKRRNRILGKASSPLLRGAPVVRRLVLGEARQLN